MVCWMSDEPMRERARTRSSTRRGPAVRSWRSSSTASTSTRSATSRHGAGAERDRSRAPAVQRAADGGPVFAQPDDRQLHPDRRGDERHRRAPAWSSARVASRPLQKPNKPASIFGPLVAALSAPRCFAAPSLPLPSYLVATRWRSVVAARHPLPAGHPGDLAAARVAVLLADRSPRLVPGLVLEWLPFIAAPDRLRLAARHRRAAVRRPLPAPAAGGQVRCSAGPRRP